MRVALVHYWLVTMRGGEKVLEALCKLYPQADIFTHVYAPEAMPQSIRSHNVHTSFINSLPAAKRFYKHYLPLMPFALEQLDLRGYDMVISSEAGPAKGILTDTHCTHICYCHSPMRYLWDFYQDYLEEMNPATRLLMRFFSHRLRMWDALSAQRVDHFIANSDNVAKRIQKHYRRESTVIHPPVDVASFAPANGNYNEPENYYLYFGQLVGYKRADLAIEACNRLQRQLVILGEGPECEKLQKLAGSTIRFVGRKNHADMVHLVQRCKALLFPGEEDFGIVPLEVMAAGRPVIAYAKGGALETVVHEKTGILFADQTISGLTEAMTAFEKDTSWLVPAQLTQHAQLFSEERFAKAVQDFILQNNKRY